MFCVVATPINKLFKMNHNNNETTSATKADNSVDVSNYMSQNITDITTNTNNSFTGNNNNSVGESMYSAHNIESIGTINQSNSINNSSNDITGNKIESLNIHMTHSLIRLFFYCISIGDCLAVELLLKSHIQLISAPAYNSDLSFNLTGGMIAAANNRLRILQIINKYVIEYKLSNYWSTVTKLAITNQDYLILSNYNNSISYQPILPIFNNDNNNFNIPQSSSPLQIAILFKSAECIAFLQTFE